MLLPGWIYIALGPWHFGDFRNIFLPNLGDGQKKVLRFEPEMWKRKRKLEAEAVEAVNFLWKRNRKHFDERGWKRKRTRKRKC